MIEEPRTRDRAATRALVLGLLGLWFGIFAPFAIWSGARSLLRIQTSDGVLTGGASAGVGLVTGLVGLAAVVAFMGVMKLQESRTNWCPSDPVFKSMGMKKRSEGA